MSAVDGFDGFELEAVSVCAGRATLLRDLSLRIQPGRVTAILGPNGAGKSTLLSLLSGLRKPTAGQVHLGGRAVATLAKDSAAWARRLAMLMQHNPMEFGYTVEEVVALGRYPHRTAPAVDEAHIAPACLAAVGLADLAQRRVPTLSGGEQARVHLARCLAQLTPGGAADGGASGPAGQWLLLDEPTAALDWLHQHTVLQQARTWCRISGPSSIQSGSVVVVLHDLNLAARYADEVVVLSDILGDEDHAADRAD